MCAVCGRGGAVAKFKGKGAGRGGKEGVVNRMKRRRKKEILQPTHVLLLLCMHCFTLQNESVLPQRMPRFLGRRVDQCTTTAGPYYKDSALSRTGNWLILYGNSEKR